MPALLGNDLDRIDPCLLGCGHGWHGNACADRVHGAQLAAPRHPGCKCPGVFGHQEV